MKKKIEKELDKIWFEDGMQETFRQSAIVFAAIRATAFHFYNLAALN